MGCATDPATIPNKEPGMLNQLLALKELSPPFAVMLSDGYMFACAMPTDSLLARSAYSLAFTSGRLFSKATGYPVGICWAGMMSFSFFARLMEEGMVPVSKLNAFS
ncbi:hypothetical protein D3C85_1281580 [compost metagenome]